MMNNLNLVDQYVNYFNLDDNMLGLNVAMINAGSVIGGLFAGQLCDKWGRKMGIAASAVITLIAVAIQASATHEAAFLVGRILLGISITVNGTAAPVWVMEMAHPKWRGFLGGMYMAIWYFAAIIVSCIALGTYRFDSTWAWRGLAVGQIVPSIMSLILLPWAPESPRWLISKDRNEEAFDLLVTLHGKGNAEDALVQAEYKEIRDTLHFERTRPGSFKALVFPRSNLHRFGIVIALNIFAQVAGSNIVSSYSGLVFEGAGITDVYTQMCINIGINVFCFFCAVAGCFSIERLGRKSLLLGVSCLMVLLLVIICILSALYGDGSNPSASYGNLAMIFLFSGAYAFAFNPLTFVYPAEIMNYSQRAKGIAVGQMACYAFGFLNQYTTPIAMNNIGWRYYAINAAWDVGICAIIWFWFVETKGLALEEVDQLFDGVVHTEGIRIGDGTNISLKLGEDVEKVQTTPVAKDILTEE
ncbi:Major facilitator superfamily domain, general substrate transporter [Pleurostoma richardsiae]|uniref:Major facilitator superfamily domain, general substrate transporter n=1 Tax=Pleurostoma richardsiae TaxID=41990 RepID=A0AA38RMZ9_9PEZI|nr:Major facilitator superfamily domain, general substrate transporter [Pleurostoma richardsiae]